MTLHTSLAAMSLLDAATVTQNAFNIHSDDESRPFSLKAQFWVVETLVQRGEEPRCGEKTTELQTVSVAPRGCTPAKARRLPDRNHADYRRGTCGVCRLTLHGRRLAICPGPDWDFCAGEAAGRYEGC
ncbi:hypothetical protein PAMP_023920 [Pampus punctatissimus]